MSSPLLDLSNEVAALVEAISPSVVVVHGRRNTPSSGVVWRKGLIVTAEHTLRNDDPAVTFAGGERTEAKLVGRDPGTDIALLKADTSIAPVRSAPEASARVGDLTLVIGRSPNSGPNASLGIISAVSGPWRTWRGGQLDQYIRLDANVFPGSSGGAVVDGSGIVIGIATSALSRIAGLAIPAATITRVVDLLVQKGSVPQGYLGIGLHPVPVPESFRKSLDVRHEQGLMVLSLEPGGPAEQAGILVGDIVLEIETRPVEEIEDLQSILGAGRIGTPVRLLLIRGGERKELSVVVGERRVSR